MRKMLRIDDVEYEISPISYEEFMLLEAWSGASDMAYAAFLRRNALVNVRDFRPEVLVASTLELRPDDGRVLLFDVDGGGETWTPYTPRAAPSTRADAEINHRNWARYLRALDVDVEYSNGLVQ